jgi:hypothetical protein
MIKQELRSQGIEEGMKIRFPLDDFPEGYVPDPPQQLTGPEYYKVRPPSIGSDLVGAGGSPSLTPAEIGNAFRQAYNNWRVAETSEPPSSPRCPATR